VFLLGHAGPSAVGGPPPTAALTYRLSRSKDVAGFMYVSHVDRNNTLLFDPRATGSSFPYTALSPLARWADRFDQVFLSV